MMQTAGKECNAFFSELSDKIDSGINVDFAKCIMKNIYN